MDAPDRTRFDAETWARVRALFEEAAQRPPADRDAFLEEACGGDPTLRRQVEALLRVDDDDAPLLDTPVEEAAPALLAEMQGGDGAADITSLRDVTIGPYRPVRVLGRGGMGTVYLAERADGQFEQQVALKLVRAGLDPALVLRRFLDERAILARLSHPNIARLLDGGRTAPTPEAPEGQPYFTMEYVEGEPITDYCDAHRLPVEARLALFESVCEAVHYAHTHLVVHRDLKPSNILVTEEGTERRPTVKLLDFGIAKVLPGGEAEGGAGGEALTREPVMTPEYAAPEQVRGAPVTTATDVYALGLVLYELLAGRRPFRLSGLTTAERERVICEEPPVRMSAAVSRAVGGGFSPEAVAGARGTTAERLRRRLAGDLDAVVLKALEKTPARRYASADALLADLRRVRSGLPVVARPSSSSYRARAFVRRHRAGVAAAALVVLALVGGLGAALWQAGVAARERDQAEAAARQAREATRFLASVFDAAAPATAGTDSLTAFELLEQGAQRVDTEPMEPALHATLLHLFGGLYYAFGRYEEARAFSQRALALQQDLYGDTHPDIAASLYRLAVTDYSLGARATADSLLDVFVAMLPLLPEDGSPEQAQQLNDLAVILLAHGDFSRSEALARRAHAMNLRLYGPEHAETLATATLVAQALNRQGRLEEAEALLRDQRARLERLGARGEPAPGLHASVLQSLASVLEHGGRFDEADPLYREAIASRRALEGLTPAVAGWMLGYGEALHRNGRLAAAEGVLQEALEGFRRHFGEAAPPTLYVMRRLGDVVRDRGAYAAAEPLLLAAFQGYRNARGGGHPSTQEAAGSLVALYERWGQPEEAARYRALLARTGSAAPP